MVWFGICFQLNFDWWSGDLSQSIKYWGNSFLTVGSGWWSSDKLLICNRFRSLFAGLPSGRVRAKLRKNYILGDMCFGVAFDRNLMYRRILLIVIQFFWNLRYNILLEP